MASKCELQDFPCIEVDYSLFDMVCSDELKIDIDADSIINKSDFCTRVPILDDLLLEHLQTKDYLRDLRGRMGLYHIWIYHDNCDDHDRYTMLCVYVGKGVAEQRIMSHIRDKFPEADCIYVSFYECENRIAKYLEQLFLDKYYFSINSAENSGQEHLYSVWDEYRYIHGTELYNISEIYAERIGPGPYEV